MVCKANRGLFCNVIDFGNWNWSTALLHALKKMTQSGKSFLDHIKSLTAMYWPLALDVVPSCMMHFFERKSFYSSGLSSLFWSHWSFMAEKIRFLHLFTSWSTLITFVRLRQDGQHEEKNPLEFKKNKKIKTWNISPDFWPSWMEHWRCRSSHSSVCSQCNSLFWYQSCPDMRIIFCI